MNRIKTIIIEDEPLARKDLENLVNRIDILEIVGSYENPVDAAKILETESVILILSDIQMPKVDGITFLKNLSNRPFVIFITGHPDFAFEGFELDVIDFIIKPLLNKERLWKAIEKVKIAIAHKKHESKNNLIKIRDKNKSIFLDSASILYVKAWGDYVQIVTNVALYTVLCSMKEMERRLPLLTFVRVHRSYIVNINEIEGTKASIIILKNRVEIAIGMQYRQRLLSLMKK